MSLQQGEIMNRRSIGFLLAAGVLVLAWSVAARDFADRAPRVDRDELAAAAAEAEVPREPLTAEERLDELDELVARLYRIIDPFPHRDEMRLERRVRELEEKVERLEREVRRLELQAGR